MSAYRDRLTEQKDAEKIPANKHKHGVSFFEAREVYGDELSLTVPGPDHPIKGCSVTLATIISFSDFGTLVEGAFQPEVPVVSSSESDLGEPLEHFSSPEEMRAKAAYCAKAGIHSYAFGLWYPSMKGRVIERKITFDPPREGRSFRYSLSGWGIIRLHLYFTPPNMLQCRVAVNSEARALSRESRYPDMGAVSEWDWRVVETYAFRLSRRLASMGRIAPVVQPSAPDDASIS